MNSYSDAALLKGSYATMLQDPPKEADWKKVRCADNAEKAAQAIAKQIFGFRKSIDPEKEKLEVVTFSAIGPIRVIGIMPMDGDLMRIEGFKPDTQSPIVMIQHVGQLSLTFTKAAVRSENPLERPDDDDGLNIGYVIFDELKERNKKRGPERGKKTAKRTTSTK